MLRSEMINDVREVLRVYSIDSEVSDRHIMYKGRTKRAKYLRQRELRELGEYKDQFQQSLFMDLELVDASRVPAVITLDSTILRTVKAIPNIIGREIFKHMDVRTVDYTGLEIEVLSKTRISNIAYAPPGFIYCYKEDDGRLYFKGTDTVHKNLARVVVQCILENPEDIVDINELTTHLTDYPITGELWEIIHPEISQELLTSLQIPIDVLNNDNDDTAASTQK